MSLINEIDVNNIENIQVYINKEKIFTYKIQDIRKQNLKKR